jgi:preprotein translocase subunit SecB
MTTEQPAKGQDKATEPEFAIQRLYIKDLSLEAPNSPGIFLDEWQPEMNLDLETQTNKLDDETHEVTLSVTVTVKIKDKTAFLVEVKQAGIFTLKNFPKDQIRPMLGSYCPNVLYPYAREAVTDAVIKAGFPQLYIAPVNFDTLLEQHDAEQGDADSDSGDAAVDTVH